MVKYMVCADGILCVQSDGFYWWLDDDMEIFRRISEWLEETLLPYGGIGLMILAMCDSSFLSLPEVNDILLMTFSIAQPERTLVFAGLTTLGSVIGCAMLYSVGRRGGEAFLQRRMSGDRIERFRDWYARYGVLAIIVPSLLPPPTPFKIFVLSAGAFGVSWTRFLSAVAIGRGLRYFSQAILAAVYGEAAIRYVERNFGVIGIVLAVLIVGLVVGAVLFRRLHSRRA